MFILDVYTIIVGETLKGEFIGKTRDHACIGNLEDRCTCVYRQAHLLTLTYSQTNGQDVLNSKLQ